MKSKNLYLITLWVVCAACGSGGENSSTATTRPVKVTRATAVEYSSRDFAAMTTADDAVTMAFKVSGRVIAIPVAKGLTVHRGELLAELDSREAQLQVEAAQATLTEAESRLNRARRLLEHNAISEQEVEAIENSAAQARSAYKNSLDILSEMRLVAPFDGVVERTYVDAFQRVASGESIVRIVTPRSTTVGFTAPESLVPSLSKPSTIFHVEFDAWPGVHFDAVMKSFARTSSDALGYPVSLRLVDVDTSRYDISPGMTCIATVDVALNDKQAVSLPLTAIYAPIEGEHSVWVVGDDGRVYRRNVELGSLTGRDRIVILSGVNIGEEVVTAGVYRLHDGERVTILR